MNKSSLGADLKAKGVLTVVAIASFAAVAPLAAHAEKNRVATLQARQSASDEAAIRANEQIEVDDFNAKERHLQFQLTGAMFTGDCTLPGSWFEDHPKSYPTSMVVQLMTRDDKFTWDLVAMPWTMKPGKVVVRLLCGKDAASAKKGLHV